MEQLAERFIGLFDQHIWQPFVEAGMPSEELPQILESLARLRRLGVEATAAAMRDALERAGEVALQKAMDELSEPMPGAHD